MQRGGRREGAGRKPEGNNRVKVNFMLLPEVVTWIKSQNEKPSRVIEKIIIEKYLT